MKIPFNKPFLTGNEISFILHAVESGKISGNGEYTQKCHQFFQNRFSFNKVLLTTSCTDALEMSAILLDIQPDNEVIVPSYTFVSTVNAFVLRGAKIVFADSDKRIPNIDVNQIKKLITSKTKAIVVVHYAGIACDMDPIVEIAKQHNLFVVEDAAQAIDAYYKGKALGSIGHLSAFSFHETKNIISGEGGMLVVNDPAFERRAEIIWEKGTNRAAFFRGEVNKYGWVDIGSSFLPSEIIAAFLYAQLENLDRIQKRRLTIWNGYYEGLAPLQDKGLIELPVVPEYAVHNGHMFYIVCQNLTERTALIERLKSIGIHAVFHYLSLHKSPYYSSRYQGEELVNADRYSDCLLRLPFFNELSDTQIDYIVQNIFDFYRL